MTVDQSRLDAALVARGLARSRGHARDLVRHGAVLVNGEPAVKVSRLVGASDSVGVVTPDPDDPMDRRWVSRAAGKLLGALSDLPAGGPALGGVRAVDVGACTGGFTQVLLERGAGHVTAVDVGHGQLAPMLRADPRVTDLSGVNVRDLDVGRIGGPADVVVADLSFISLTLVMDRLHDLVRPGGDLLLLVKPQFEVGRAALDGRGVVRSERARHDALRRVVRTARELGLRLEGLVPSRTIGQQGNIEYVMWLVRPTETAGSPSWQAVCRQIERWLGIHEEEDGR